jgi:hypothetical protein
MEKQPPDIPTSEAGGFTAAFGNNQNPHSE